MTEPNAVWTTDFKGQFPTGDGVLREWWEPEAAAKFEQAAKCVDEQFSGFEIEPGVTGLELERPEGSFFAVHAPLVRLEAEIVFETILRCFPKISLATETLEWQEHPIFRGLKSLPVNL